METIYRQLQRKINSIGPGLPESKAGNDLEYLQWLFTEEQAEFAVKMDRGNHTCEEVAQSMGIPVEEAREKLTDLGRAGLVYHFIDRDGLEKYYLSTSYHGFCEWNLFRPDDAWLKPLVKHNMEGLIRVMGAAKTPMFRYIPGDPSKVENGCLDIDNKEKIIRSKRRIAKVACFCRLCSKGYAGHNVCKTDPEDYNVCICFDSFADFYLDELGTGVEITADEAVELMSHSSEKGYTHALTNSQDSEGMCNCCHCCCGILFGLRKFGAGNAVSLSNYYSQRDETKCVNCGACAKRCPSRAYRLVDGKLTFNPSVCIGCGLCLDVCEQGALKLLRKPDDQVYYPEAPSWSYLSELIGDQRRETAVI